MKTTTTELNPNQPELNTHHRHIINGDNHAIQPGLCKQKNITTLKEKFQGTNKSKIEYHGKTWVSAHYKKHVF